MDFIDWIDIRAEFTSIVFLMWAFVAVTVATISGIIAYRKWKLKEYDVTFEFAIALCVSWSFEALVRIWYMSMNVIKSLELNDLHGAMQESFIPGVLALGIVFGGSLHVHTLIKTYRNGSMSLWRKWLVSLGITTSLLLITYFLFHFFF